MRTFLDYFDRLTVIHLRRRIDRYERLIREVKRIGIPIDHKKFVIQDAIAPIEAAGFHSAAVRGCFLSHLEALSRAERDGIDSILVMEDDVIFSNMLDQSHVVEALSRTEWGMVHIGHGLSPSKILDRPDGLVQYTGSFSLAHCYAVHRRTLRTLVSFLERTLTNDPENPEGARMYPDGAFSHFRRLNPAVACFVMKPSLVAQFGSPSSLADPRWYDGIDAVRPLVGWLRLIRDESWRRFGWPLK